ncbi:hypothetical protein Q3G72_018523 [Acer saccharum]|nr:hypothetical protein Q3G72_018523 [Acer saccharum]
MPEKSPPNRVRKDVLLTLLPLLSLKVDSKKVLESQTFWVGSCCVRGFEPKNKEEWSRGNWTNGCIRKRLLLCDRTNQTGEVKKEDGFLKLETMKLPHFAEQSSVTVAECRERCLNNCSCIAYAYDAGISCMTWTGSLIDLNKFSSEGADLYIRLAHSELEKKDNTVVIIVPVVAGTITCAICTFFLWRWMAKHKAVLQHRESQLLLDTECDVYGWCGEFGSCNPEKKPICSCLRGFEPKTVQEWNRGNWTSGCVRKSPLQCERINQTGDVKKEDGFLKLGTMKLPYLAARSSVSVVNCREYCLSNCSCIAYAYDDGIGCMTWTGSLIDLQKFSIGGADLYIRLAHSELEKKDNKVVVIVPVVAGTITCAICIVFVCKWMAKHKVKLWIFPLQSNQHLQKDGMPEKSPLNRIKKDVLLTMSLLLLSLKVASKELLAGLVD